MGTITKAAFRPDIPPDIGGKKKAKGIAASGKRWENKVEARIKLLGVPYGRNLWVEYKDENGSGLAQLDFLIDHPECPIIIEAKRTECADGYNQLQLLYAPIIKHLTQQVPKLVLACEHYGVSAPLVETPAEAFANGTVYMWEL